MDGFGHKIAHPFPKRICLKVNVIWRVEFKLPSHSPARYSLRHDDSLCLL